MLLNDLLPHKTWYVQSKSFLLLQILYGNYLAVLLFHTDSRGIFTATEWVVIMILSKHSWYK